MYKRLFVIVVFSFFTLSESRADCTGPNGITGQVIYNSTEYVNQYCDGTNWIEMGHASTTGSSNCSNPAEAPGTMIYNADFNVMQYCNGAVWVSMGTVPFDSDDYGLIGHWKLDESSGSVAYDSLGLNDGSILNAITNAPTGGMVDGAYLFSKSLSDNAAVRVSYNSNIYPTSEVSYAVWVKVVSNGGNERIIQRGRDTYELILVSDGSPQMKLRVAGTTYYLNGYILDLDTWYHLATTYDGTTYALYINGILISSSAVSGTIDTLTGTMNIGYDPCCSHFNEAFDGYIDDVRIYDQGLSAAAVNNVFRQTTGPVADVTSGLVGRWKLDESSGTTVADSSGNGFNGTLINSPAWNASSGVIGGALLLDDASVVTGVSVPYNSALEPTSGITYTAWINIVSSDWYEVIVNKRRDQQLLRIDNADKLRFDLKIAGTVRVVTAPDAFEMNRWYFVAGKYDGSEMAVYIDGKKVNSAAYTGSINTYGRGIEIGVDGEALVLGENFDGYVDDVRMYNRGLSDAEIQQMYLYREKRHTFTPSTCANPSGNPGDLIFNTNYSVMQYCNGAVWVGIGK